MNVQDYKLTVSLVGCMLWVIAVPLSIAVAVKLFQIITGI